MQREVDAGYRATIDELAAQGERIVIVDGEQSEDDVFVEVVRAVS
jgi:thymidylate kinase